MGQYFDVQKALDDGHTVAQIKQYMAVKGLKPLGSDTNPFSGDQSTATPSAAPVATPPPSVTQAPPVQAATTQPTAPQPAEPAPQGIPGFFQNVGSNAGSIISGLTKLPGAVANAAIHPDQLPQDAGNFAKSLFGEYNNLVGQPFNPQTGKLQMPNLQEAGQHAYDHPIDTAMDVLPFIKPLQALAGGGKAAEAADVAANATKGAEAATSALKTPVLAPVLNNAGNVSKAALTKIFGAGELKNYAPGNTPILDTVGRYGIEDGSGHLPNYAQNTVVAQNAAGKAIANGLANADAQGAGVPLARLREIALNSEPAVLPSGSQGIGKSAVATVDNIVRKYMAENNIPNPVTLNGKGATTDAFEQGAVNIPTSLVNDIKQLFYKNAGFGSASPTPEQSLSRGLSLTLKNELEKQVPDIKQANQDYWNLQQIGDHLQGHLNNAGQLGGPESLTTSLNPLNKLNSVPGQAAVAQAGNIAKSAPQVMSNVFKNAAAGAATGGAKGGKMGNIVGNAEQAGRFLPSPAIAVADTTTTPPAQATTTTPSPTPQTDDFQALTQKLAQTPTKAGRSELINLYKLQHAGAGAKGLTAKDAQTSKVLQDDFGSMKNLISQVGDAGLNQAAVNTSNAGGTVSLGNPKLIQAQAHAASVEQSLAYRLHGRAPDANTLKQLEPLFPQFGKDSAQQINNKMAVLGEMIDSLK